MKLSITEVPTSVPASLRAGAVEQHVTGRGAGRQRHGRARDRVQAAVGAQPEAGVVAAAVTGVGHVDQVTGNRDAVGQQAAGGDDAVADQAQRAAGPDPQHRDLVAAGVDRDQEPAAGRELQRALRGQPGSCSGPAGRERGPGLGGQRSVRVPVKRPDRVGSRRVVVDIDVPHHRRRAGQGRGGRGRRDRHGCRRRDAGHQRAQLASGPHPPCLWSCTPGADRRPRDAKVTQTSSAAPFSPAKPDPVDGTWPPRCLLTTYSWPMTLRFGPRPAGATSRSPGPDRRRSASAVTTTAAGHPSDGIF